MLYILTHSTNQIIQPHNPTLRLHVTLTPAGISPKKTQKIRYTSVGTTFIDTD